MYFRLRGFGLPGGSCCGRHSFEVFMKHSVGSPFAFGAQKASIPGSLPGAGIAILITLIVVIGFWILFAKEGE